MKLHILADKIGALLALSLMGGCQSGTSPPRTSASLSYMNSQALEFRAEISVLSESGRVLKIECIENCPSQIRLVEEFPDTPLGIMGLSLEQDYFFIISSSGNSFQLKIYDISDNGIIDIFHHYSSSFPIISEHGNLIRIELTALDGKVLFELQPDGTIEVLSSDGDLLGNSWDSIRN